MPRRRFLLILLLALSLPTFAQSLLIAAGAGYKRPVAELSELFQKQSGVRVEQIYGHMGGIVTQAAQSGDIAVVFGDRSYLATAGSLDFAGFQALGTGRLVLAWPAGGHLANPGDLQDSRYARIAIPNPKAAIYGIAASEFLERSGLSLRVKDRLQTVATVPQVSAYLISGEVDAGFINLTEALAIRPRIGGYLEIEPGRYNTIHIVAGVLRGHAQRPEVQALGRFIDTPEARAILSRHGL